jgi:hypothetical protein
MKFETMHIILAVAFALIAISFWYAQKKPFFQFDAFDLIMTDGKVDKIALSYMLVLALSSWIMVDLQINSKMTEGYFAIFIGAWITPLVSKVVFGKNEVSKDV